MLCPACGIELVKESISIMVCPKCGKKQTRCEVYSRVVGYIRPVEQWNDGKQTEYHDRKIYKDSQTTII